MLILEKTPSQKFSKSLARIKFTQLIIADLNRLDDIKNRGLKETYLLNSYVLNLVALWQTFIDDLLRYAITTLIQKNPESVESAILKENLEDRLRRFNTPNTGNIDDIFKSILGIQKITNLIPEFENTRHEINETVKIRHSIAHTGFSNRVLTMEDNFNRMETLYKTARELEEIVKEKII